MEVAKNTVRLIRRAARLLAGRDLLIRQDLQRPKVTLGNDGAQWTLDVTLLNARSVIYSVGVGTDVSFDLALIELIGATVHAFDPTPRSIAWVAAQKLPALFRFFDFGLADYDGAARFYAPAVRTHVSFSLDNVHASGEVPVVASVHRLSTIMAQLGHDRIDLLKLDIEGAEYAAIRDLIQSKIEVRQILVEFHHRFPRIGAEATRQALGLLRSAGFAVFHVSGNGEEVSLIRQ